VCMIHGFGELTAVGAGEPAEILVGISNNGNLNLSGVLCNSLSCSSSSLLSPFVKAPCTIVLSSYQSMRCAASTAFFATEDEGKKCF
jgi:hypothetical protein